SYRHIDGLVQALRSGGAPEDGLSYGDEEVRVDVCAVPPEHRAFLHLRPSTGGTYPECDENFSFSYRHPHSLAILNSCKQENNY
ncbi:hypothetical protein M91_05071, partial [Bos mutus]